jgi:gliding motility-associated-like protein
MLVRNGLYWLNPENTLDTIWCENTIYDSVHVFLHPALLVVGDTIVCQGTLTDATVTAVGVDSCTYQWSTSLNSITGGIQPGNHLAVVPYADTSTYYVRVTSPQGCVAWDSIHAYLVSPRLSMSPADGRICPGDTVILVGSNANSYTWTASPNDPSLTGQDTAATVMVTPQQSTTYTLVGHGGSGDNICDATPLTTQVTVFPYPVPTVNINPGIVDSEDPVVMLRDESPYSVASTWVFDGGEIVEGREVTHTFEEATGVDSVYVTLKNVNELGCQTVYPFGIPVNLYTAWFPNIFTPGSEDVNSTFRLYTINRYEIFHIYIYNRRGELVFDSDDPEFEWDGTYKGSPCPQGTYVYICRFRKPGTFNLSEIYGSITLVR